MLSGPCGLGLLMNEEKSSRGQQTGVKSDHSCAAQVTFEVVCATQKNENTLHVNT